MSSEMRIEKARRAHAREAESEERGGVSAFTDPRKTPKTHFFNELVTNVNTS